LCEVTRFDAPLKEIMNHRLYSFVANHYLSSLQCGLQTAHVVSELSLYKINTPQFEAYSRWAQFDKTIIICGAGNHAGVVECYDRLLTLANRLDLPVALFREDEQSMNGMATVCGVVVPEKFWNVTFVPETKFPSPSPGHIEPIRIPAQWIHDPKDGSNFNMIFTEGTAEFDFISHIKGYRLA
jgi:hypothetical protein